MKLQGRTAIVAVSFLASDAAAFMTGQTMPLDGGSAMVSHRGGAFTW